MRSKKIIALILITMLSIFLAQCAPVPAPEKMVETPTVLQTVEVQGVETEAPAEVEVQVVETESPAKQQPIQLTMMVQGQDEFEVFDKLGKEFTSLNPNITITVQDIPAENWGDYFDKIATMIAGGTNIDLVRVVSEGAQLIGSLGIAEPIDSYINADKAFKDEFMADVDPHLLLPFQFEGNQYGLPFEWNTCAIFYNTRLLQEAGLEPPSPEWTKDDFLEYAKKLTKDVDGDGVTDIWGYQDSYFTFCIEPWIFNAGGSLLDEEWKTSKVTDPNNAEALKWMRDLIWEYKVSPTGSEVGFAGTKQMFIAGKIAMVATGRWNVNAFINAGFTEWDVVPFPKWRQQINIYGAGSTYMLKAGKNKDAAWQFLKFISSKEAITEIAKEGWSIPQRKSVGYDKSVMGLYPPANYKFWYDTITDSRPVTAPPKYNKFDEIFSRYLDLVIKNEMSVEEALQKMDAELNQALAE